MAKYYRPGTKVVLKANKKEGWPRQVAVVDGKSGREMYVVTLLKEFWDKEDRDGIREVYEGDIMSLHEEKMKAKKR